jgi:hypothetical protein
MSVCYTGQDLYDPKGVYLGSACFIGVVLSYYEAVTFCRANGMNIFDISQESTKTALFNYATQYFGTFWISIFVSLNCIENSSGKFIVSTQGCFEKATSYCGF